MTARVIQNVEQYNRDMFKLQDANKDTPPVGVRQFRNPFMQQSVNALLTAILAKGTGKGADAVPVSSLSPGDLATAESEEASGVFRRPDKTGKKVRRPEGEERGERVGKASGNVADTRQEGLSEKAKAAGSIAKSAKDDLQQNTKRLKALQDDAGEKNAALTSASAVRQKALQDEIDEYDSALKTLGQIDIEKKKALKRARGSGNDKSSGPAGKKKRQKLIKKLTAEVEDNLRQMKRIRKTERVSAVNRMADEKKALAKSLLNVGIKTQQAQKAAGKKVTRSKAARAAAAAEAGKALSASKGFAKARTIETRTKDAKTAASAAKKAKKEKVAAILKKEKEKESKARARGDDAEPTPGKKAPDVASKTPGQKAAGAAAKRAAAGKHADAKAKEKTRQGSVNHKVSTAKGQHEKHTAKTDKETAKEMKDKSTPPTRKVALKNAQLKTLEAYSKMTAYDAANPKVSGGKYMFRVNTKTDSEAEINKERADWEKWSAEHERLTALYLKAKAAQNALLAKQPTLRGGGVRGSGTRPGAVETGGSN